jgi:4-amino-4-deoxy-L-arabinose transferase-like glycosyltransferase
VVILVALQDEPVGGDGLAYRLTAEHIAEGDGYLHPLDPTLPEAHHPPAWYATLAVPIFFGVEGRLGLQVYAAMVGSATVLLVGLAGREVAGRRVGLLAAGLAALSAGFWRFERELLSETLVLPVMATVILVAYRYRAEPSLRRAIALGGSIGLAVITKADLAVLMPLLALPLVLRNRRPPQEQILQLAAVAVVVVACIVPWTVYNLGRFDEPVLLSTSLGSAMQIANCDSVYAGERMGYYDLACSFRVPRDPPDMDASERDLQLRDTALDHMRANLDRLPAVVLARYGRTWSLYRPGQQIDLDHEWSLTPNWVSWTQLFTFWVVAPAALAGGLLLRRRAIVIWPLLVPFAGVLVTNLAITGEPRYRSPAEVSLVILAAVALDAVGSRWRTRARPGPTPV